MPNCLCFPGLKNADLSLGNHAEGLGEMHLPVFLFTTQRAAGTFCFLAGGFPRLVVLNRWQCKRDGILFLLMLWFLFLNSFPSI